MNPYADIMTARRAPSWRPRMPVADRAKIFAPYAALRGYEESVHARERLYVPRPELARDRQEQLDRRLRGLRPGDQVTVTFFQRLQWEGPELGEYRTVSGAFVGVNGASATLVLDSARVELRNLIDVGRR